MYKAIILLSLYLCVYTAVPSVGPQELQHYQQDAMEQGFTIATVYTFYIIIASCVYMHRIHNYIFTLKAILHAFLYFAL